MAPLPTVLLSGYELLAATDPAPAQGIFIPLATLTGLTAAEADEETGDGRKVAFELCRALQTSFAAIPLANRPTRMNAAKGTPAGVDANTVSQSYTFTYQLGISGSDVADEPA